MNFKQVGGIIESEDGFIWGIRDNTSFPGDSVWRDDLIGPMLEAREGELDVIKAASKIFPVFIDIGAHVGHFAVRASKLFNQVIAVEPVKKMYKMLLINYLLNDCDNSVAYNYALFSEAKPLKIYAGRGGCCQLSNLGNPECYVSTNFNTMLREEEIQGITLDYLLETTATKLPFVVKLDTEGAELDILKGGIETLKRQSLWIIEHHEKSYKIPGRRDEIISFLDEKGFALIKELDSDAKDEKLIFSNAIQEI